ncbi:hypothetical protein VTH06DRAFT_1719 [Thermothelomyces fergusii]
MAALRELLVRASNCGVVCTEEEAWDRAKAPPTTIFGNRSHSRVVQEAHTLAFPSPISGQTDNRWDHTGRVRVMQDVGPKTVSNER